jgi:hypothetical protein
MTVSRMSSPVSRTALAVIAVVALVSSGCAFFGEGINIELTQDQLQTVMDAVFPVDNADEGANTTVALSAPTVTMPDGGDRIGFGLDIAVTVVMEPGEGPLAERADERQTTEATEPEGRGARARNKVKSKASDTADAVQERAADRDPTTLTGTVAVSSGIRYDNDKGQIFLDGVNIDQLTIEQLPQRFNDPVLRLTSAAITRALQETPIFTIDESTTAGGLVDTLLRDITIADGVLRITIGVG